MIGVTSIDSLKIRIPISQCEILETRLSSHKITIFEETGEVDEGASFKDRSFLVDENGASTRWVIGRDPSGGFEDVLYILLNSKLLRGDYFQGITKGNLRAVYGLLMSQGVAKFSYEAFEVANCVDIDFKKDYSVSSPLAMSKTIKWMSNKAKPTKKLNGGILSKDSKTDRMIQFSTRRGATPTVPFVKFYDKKLESKSEKAAEFFGKYFPEGVPDIFRSEWTLKNKRHAKEGFQMHEESKGLFLDVSGEFGTLSLKDLLNIPQYVHDIILSQVIKRHVEKGTKQMSKKENDLNPIDQVILNFATYLRDECQMELVDVIALATNGVKKDSKYTYKKKITELYSIGISQDKAEIEKDQLNILDDLGLV